MIAVRYPGKNGPESTMLSVMTPVKLKRHLRASFQENPPAESNRATNIGLEAGCAY